MEATQGKNLVFVACFLGSLLPALGECTEVEFCRQVWQLDLHIARKSETVVFILLWYLQHSVTSQVGQGQVNGTTLLVQCPACKLTKMARAQDPCDAGRRARVFFGLNGGAGPFLLSTVFPIGQLLIFLREVLLKVSYLMITGILVLLPKEIKLFYLLY